MGIPVEVRPCVAGDLPQLEEWSPTTTADVPHGRWLERQAAGEITFLLAFVGDEIVGIAKVRWLEPREPAHRPVPELFQLSVWPENARGRGVGTALIAEAERLAQRRGVTSLTMGVDVTNDRAMKLYERLGYRDWGDGVREDAYQVVDANGEVVIQRDLITYVIKEL